MTRLYSIQLAKILLVPLTCTIILVLSYHSFCKYCYINIVLFTIAFCKVIDFNLLYFIFAITSFFPSFLQLSLFPLQFSLLKAIAIKFPLLFTIIFNRDSKKSDNYTEGNTANKPWTYLKNLIQKIKRLRAITFAFAKLEERFDKVPFF